MFFCRPWLQSEGDKVTAQTSVGLGRMALDIKGNEASGLRNMPWKAANDNPLAPRVLDFNWLISQPLLPFLVNHIPPQTLYLSLMEHGLEDSVEVIEWLRGGQLAKVLDFDLWDERANGDADVNPARALDWVRAWFEVGPQFAADRFCELEEETIVLVCSRFLDIRPEGVAQLPEGESADDYWTTMDGRFHLKVTDANPESFELVHALVDALYRKDVKLAQSILAHSAMLIRDETLEDGKRWRRARLADAGFVEKDEAISMLTSQGVDQLLKLAPLAVEVEKKRGSTSIEFENESDELDRARLLELEDDQRYSTVQSVLGAEKILSLCGFSPKAEDVAEDEAVLEVAVETIGRQCEHLLSIWQTQPLRIKGEGRLSIESGLAYIAQEDEEKAASLKSRIARIANSFLAATQQTLDSDGLARALTLARGAMNIGLQLCDRNREVLTLNSLAKVDTERHAQIIEAIGPEYLFKLGWAKISEVSHTVAQRFEELALQFPQSLAFLSKPLNIRFDDGTSCLLHLSSLVKRGRFTEVRTWLSESESLFPTEIFFVVSSLLNRVPFYPEVLNSSDNHRASQARKPFEDIEEVERALALVEGLGAETFSKDAKA